MLAGLFFELLDDLFFDLSHNQLWHDASILSSAINDSTHSRRGRNEMAPCSAQGASCKSWWDVMLLGDRTKEAQTASGGTASIAETSAHFESYRRHTGRRAQDAKGACLFTVSAVVLQPHMHFQWKHIARLYLAAWAGCTACYAREFPFFEIGRAHV